MVILITHNNTSLISAFVSVSSEPPANAYLASSFDKAIELTQSGRLADKIESVFITGGSSIYKVRACSKA